jgi:hypothetical protein
MTLANVTEEIRIAIRPVEVADVLLHPEFIP